ncbi:class I SAM-dependent methyltransferase [Nocardia sp. NPDC005978]|uniref:class I SAM-dependent methyltransferase n=1 Tax=unclassified Nocardia TaxID=2637762 RepID=UPI0033AB7175
MGAHTHSHGHGHSHGTGHDHSHGRSHGHGHGHTHDGIDWTLQLANLRRDDAMGEESSALIARRLIGLVTTELPTIVDIGAGAGGQSAALARELAGRGGGRLVIVDAVPELIEAARATVDNALAGDDRVRVETVHADAADDALADLVPRADVVWASRMVHHLPDQQAGTDRLARLLHPEGWLALSEGGLGTRCLPWDLGIGAPGLQDRLLAARDAGFGRMRAEIPAAVRMPYGWGTALERAGLHTVTSFSVLTEHPAPPSKEVRDSVVAWLEALRTHIGADIAAADRETIDALLDSTAPTFIATREDIFMLGASTIYLGQR